MNKQRLSTLIGAALIALVLNGCSSIGSAVNLYDQLGGMGQVTKLAGGMVTSLAKSPELRGMLSNIDTSGATTKVADQLCAALGGGCEAPFSADQIASAASKLTPGQKDAVKSSFNSALKTVSDSPELTSAISKSLGSQISGIIGSII